MKQISIDTRWDGIAGIQRYSREVLPRLRLPWRPLGFGGNHLAPADALRAVPQDGLIYTPGYNAFVRASRQIVTLHDLIQLQTSWPGRAKYLAYYNAVVKPVVCRTRVVVTVSETSKSLIADWLGDANVEIVNAGIGCSAAFHPDVEAAKARDPYLMYVGNLRPHKNVVTVLDALSLTRGVGLRMLLPAREHDLAKTLLAERRLTGRVELLATVSDEELASHYRGAAATLMPSTLEGFGLPALESIMTGTPVIYWRGCAAVAETVGGRGIAVDEAARPTAWVDAIEAATAIPARVEPPRGYSWDDTAASIEQSIRIAAAQ